MDCGRVCVVVATLLICARAYKATATSTVTEEESTQRETESTTGTSSTKAEACAESEWGCCFHNATAATGPGLQGCPCNDTEFGCCPGGVESGWDVISKGPEYEGCLNSCNTSFGCCPDGKTPAHGPNQEGCCLLTAYGCCPDNCKPADGPDFKGCECQYAQFGCCPDNVTIATGPSNKGCGCQYADYGCCPDRLTEATGASFDGCKCHTYQFGCCPDGVTIATGPNGQGCYCQHSPFGCCGDDQTHAKGPNKQGCDCAASKYGCCVGGVTEATGPKFEGCAEKPEDKQAVCGLKLEPGPCGNLFVAWYYDSEYGSCSRFWYSGCEGNGNRFNSKEECKNTCVSPPAKDVCRLPQIKGACDGYNVRWFFDKQRGTCSSFIYGGCLGNNNNFKSLERCREMCEPERAIEIKTGACPANDTSSEDASSECLTHCGDDADCRGVLKCCVRGCSRVCMSPETPVLLPSTTNRPDIPQAPLVNTETKPNIELTEGGKATLRCLFHGNPPPKNTWRFGEITIEGDAGRYRLLSDGALEIASLFRNDSGVYFCVGQNEFGIAEQQVTLTVDDAVNLEAGIAGAVGSTVTGELGKPLVVRCLAFGSPLPLVYWYRGRDGAMVPYSTPVFEPRDFDFAIKRLSYDTLDEYECQAYNGNGRPATWQVTVQAYRQPGDDTFNEYLVAQQSAVYVTPCVPATIPFPALPPTTTRQSELDIPALYIVPVRTSLSPASTTLHAGSQLSLPCDVDGYPEPEVRWTKDDELVKSSDRIWITDSRLTISRAGVNDSGEYTCHAANSYSSHSSSVRITVQEVLIPATCIDFPTFANCALIVQSRFCVHKYYSKLTEAIGAGFDGYKCHTYKFGCCPDGVTIATGPNGQGCYCQHSPFGCCGDDQTHAKGPNKQGCDCATSKYGCCVGGVTEATGPKFEGCADKPEDKQAVCGLKLEPGPCGNLFVAWYYDSEYGSCSRFWYSGCEGNGNRFNSKEECESTCVSPPAKDVCRLPQIKGACDGYNVRWFFDKQRGTCSSFIYGGCLGNNNNFKSLERCREMCEPEIAIEIKTGACPDNDTSSEDASSECLTHCGDDADCRGVLKCCARGCSRVCLSPETPVLLPSTTNRPEVLIPVTCIDFPTFANCALIVQSRFCVHKNYSKFCCKSCVEAGHMLQIRLTEAIGAGFDGYKCHTYQFGCCPDGVTIATGPNGQGCYCQHSPFGCCGDDQTHAKGPNKQGCDCATSKYGCCVGGVTEATGPKFEGCADKPEDKQAACALKFERGPCRNYSVGWYYDSEYGGCSRSWYGGCEGNGNRFNSKEECESTCVSPPAKDVCRLPQIKGACDGYNVRWFFDKQRGTCSSFIYGGCLGNNNNFKSLERCREMCEPERAIEIKTGACPDNDTSSEDASSECLTHCGDDADCRGVLKCCARGCSRVCLSPVTPVLLPSTTNRPEVLIPATCIDNPRKANCSLIVHGRFCVHKYYTKYCCKSCVEAGQLDPRDTDTSNYPY